MTTLRDLLAEGAHVRAKERELRDAKRNARAAEKLPHAVRGATAADLNALARRIKDELLWRSTSVVYLFDQQHCSGCGQTATTLSGVFVHQEHTREAGATRKLRLVAQHPLLPIKREVWETTVSMCFQCMSEHEPHETPEQLLYRLIKGTP